MKAPLPANSVSLPPDAGFDSAPRALGFDEHGREMLTYLPGETIGDRDPWPAWASADSMLAQAGRWLRRVHDLTADFTPPADECWFIGGALGPGLVVGHQDAAPYNAVVDGDRLVGFCDWDIAGPSTRAWDLAFSALSWAPLASPRDGTPGSAQDLQERSRRLRRATRSPASPTRTSLSHAGGCRRDSTSSAPPAEDPGAAFVDRRPGRREGR